MKNTTNTSAITVTIPSTLRCCRHIGKNGEVAKMFLVSITPELALLTNKELNRDKDTTVTWHELASYVVKHLKVVSCSHLKELSKNEILTLFKSVKELFSNEKEVAEIINATKKRFIKHHKDCLRDKNNGKNTYLTFNSDKYIDENNVDIGVTVPANFKALDWSLVKTIIAEVSLRNLRVVSETPEETIINTVERVSIIETLSITEQIEQEKKLLLKTKKEEKAPKTEKVIRRKKTA